MRLHLGLITCALILSHGSTTAIAADSPPATQANATLRAAVDEDALALASVAQRVGDDAVLHALTEGGDVALRLSAVRAAPFLHSPELALSPLAQLARGRDPELAPAAARRAFVIAQALVLDESSYGERSLAPLSAAQPALASLAGATDARQDIRLLAGEASALLATLTDSAPTPKAH